MTATAFLLLAAAAVVFASAVVFRDLDCRVCGGKGRFRNPIPFVGGTVPCPKCKGRKRTRPARKVWDRFMGARRT